MKEREHSTGTQYARLFGLRLFAIRLHRDTAPSLMLRDIKRCSLLRARCQQNFVWLQLSLRVSSDKFAIQVSNFAECAH